MNKISERELDELLSKSEQPSEEELDALLSDEEPKLETYDPLSTGIKTAADILLAGHYPQVESVLQGNLPGSKEYIKQRDLIAKNLEQSKIESPYAAGAGTTAGILGSIITPAVSAPAKLGSLGKAAFGIGSNIAQQLLQNPGEVEGEVNPLQLKERIQKTKENITSPLGATLTLLPAIGPAVNKFKKAEEFAFQHMEPTAKKIEKANKLEKASELKGLESSFSKKEIGKFALENKLISAGDTVVDTWNKAMEMKNQVGSRIGNLYGRIQNQLDQISNKSSTQDVKYILSPYDVHGDMKEAIDFVNKNLGPSVNRKNAISAITSYLEDLQDLYPDNPRMDDLMEIRGKIADRIKDFEKDPSAQTDTVVGFRNLLKYLNGRISDSIKTIDKVVGSNESSELMKLNDQYSKLQYIADVTGKASARAEGAAQKSLPFLLSPAAYGTAAYAATNALTSDPIKAAVAGTLFGVGNLATKALEGKGNSIMANVANQSIPRAMMAPARIQTGFETGYKEAPFIQAEQMLDQALMQGIPPFVIDQEIKKQPLSPTEQAKLRNKNAKAVK